MANTPNQKLKQLYLMKILMEQTDEEHPMSVKDLIYQLGVLNFDRDQRIFFDCG